MNLSEIVEILEAEVIVGHDALSVPVISGAASDLMSDILRKSAVGAILITGLNNVQAARTAAIAGVAAVVLVRKKQPDQDLVDKAREYGLPLLSTPYNMYSTCGRLFSKGLKSV